MQDGQIGMYAVKVRRDESVGERALEPLAAETVPRGYASIYGGRGRGSEGSRMTLEVRLDGMADLVGGELGRLQVSP
jgi:hypothetical protein